MSSECSLLDKANMHIVNWDLVVCVIFGDTSPIASVLTKKTR